MKPTQKNQRRLQLLMLYRAAAIFSCMVTGSLNVLAQDTTSHLFSPLVNEVIGLSSTEGNSEKVQITNLSAVRINEAPGAVYIITADDIRNNGYRDLLEVLADVPGFVIASDVQNGTGLCIRGAWASEAKVLVMIDGMIMNDMSYGSFVLGGRIPLLNIERIEIIKGASSSIYGGIAGLGVINIITKEGNSSRGSSFQADAGYSNSALSGQRISLANTSYLGNDFELSFNGSVFSGNKSNVQYYHADSMFTNFADSSRISESYMQMRLKRRGVEYKTLYEDYSFQATHESIHSLCRTFLNELNYDERFNKFRLRAGINLKNQIPWNTQYGDPAIYDLQNLITRRFTANLNASYEFNDKIGMMAGLIYYNDYMRYYRPFLELNTGNTSETYNAFAGFGEIYLRTRFVNLFAGGRADYYETFDPYFAPRISATKEFKSFHYKLIYGQSFKIPTLQNINLAFLNTTPILPEKIKDFQAEFGYSSKKMNLQANLFYTMIQDVIVYGYDYGTFLESYVNSGDMTFAGGELLARFKLASFNATASYSYYRLLACEAPDFMVDTADVRAGTLAVPTHKISLRLNYRFDEHNSLSLNYIYQSAKTAVEQTDADLELYENVYYKPTSLIDFVYQYDGLLEYFDVQVGVKNILNTRNNYLYPLAAGYPTSMGMGREYFLMLKIKL